MMVKMMAVKWLSLRSKICESSESDCEESEVVEPTVNRKPPKGLDTMSMEDWNLRLCLFYQSASFKKIM